MFVGYFLHTHTHTHTVYEDKCRMFILTQLNINQRQRLWVHTCQPLLYPLQYLHGMHTTHAEVINADILAFIRS